MNISDRTHDLINKIVFDAYTTGQANRSEEMADFLANLDIVECKRTEKDADWLSDVFIPEAPTIFITEAAHEATQYFSTRDFCEPILENITDPHAKLQCKLAKKIINFTLNNKDIHHYIKYMQAREINRLVGYVYAMCWWEQDVKQVQTGVTQTPEVGLDDQGNIQQDDYGQTVTTMKETPVFDDIVIKDQFNWIPIDPRNVFTDNKYSYTVQDEDVIIRSEKTYEELKQSEKSNNYFNLDKVLDLLCRKDQSNKKAGESDTSQQTYNESEKYSKTAYSNKPFDVLSFYGHHWVKVKSRDKYGFPEEIGPGYDDDERPSKDAEYALVRHDVAYRGGTKVTIRFQAEPLRDGKGRPYKPIIRGICYVHATKKNGMSTAKYLREMQIATNDTLNISNDRVKMATFPTLKTTTFEAQNNDSLYFEPEHVMHTNDINDLQEFRIQDNIQGALQQVAIFRGAMEEVAAVFPGTKGDPGKAGVTATASQGADMRSNIRNNYKDLTWTNTFDSEFYWQILQHTWQFMHPKTIEKLFTKDEIAVFNPVGDYTYQPVTASVEAESNKYKKIQNYDQNIGRLAGLVKIIPEFLPLIIMFEKEILELQGAELREYAEILDKIAQAKMQPEGGKEAGGDQTFTSRSPKDQGDSPTSNQSGIEMGNGEQYARGM